MVQIDGMLSAEEVEELRGYPEETMAVRNGRSAQTAASGELYYSELIGNQRNCLIFRNKSLNTASRSI